MNPCARSAVTLLKRAFRSSITHWRPRPLWRVSFSVADAILFYVEFWADKTNIALPGNLAAHYRRMLTRPAVQRVLREEGYNPATLGQSPADPIRL